MRLIHLASPLVILILAMALIVESAASHGLGEQKLERIESGPFRISAWVDPIEPTTDDELHITVALEDREGLVTNATVQVEMVQREDRTITFDAAATHEQAVNKLHYEAAFDIAESGDYDVTVQVTNNNGNGEADFSINIAPGNGDTISPGWVIAGVAGTLIVILMVWNRVQLARSNEDK